MVATFRGAAVLAAALSIGALLAGSLPAAATGAAVAPIDPESVGIVVLVDESSSLQESGVNAERQATQTIVQSVLSTNSQLAVVGFGGRDGDATQSPVDVVCEPTTVSNGPNRSYLDNCAQNLKVRTKAEGDDTDFPDAIDQGLSLLSGMTGVKDKMIFLLTDGQLYVKDDPTLGTTPDARQARGEQRMIDELAKARQQGVSIWPLGFNDAKLPELNAMAAGGAQSNPACPDSSRPVARIAATTGDITASLAAAFSAAGCLQSVGPVTGSSTLTLTIPPVATDGSIAVTKSDPNLQVAFIDPNGVTAPLPDGSADGSDFQVSGQSSAVEVLRIRNPVAGAWTVKVTAPSNGTAHSVSATLFWQGAVESSVSISPPSPRPGSPVTVQVVLATRRGPLAAPDALAGIHARAVLTGDGFGPVNVALSPGPGGQFTGQVTMPAGGTGAFHLVGLVSGTGISNDQRPLDGVLNTGSVPMIAAVSFDPPTVAPGDDADGTVQFQNNTSTARTVSLRLTDVAGGQMTLSPGSDRVPPGASQVTFHLLVAAGTPVGTLRGTLIVADAASPNAPYADPSLTITVAYPPPWWQRYWWALAAGLVIVLAVAAWLWLTARRRRRLAEVRHLAAKLIKDGRTVFTLNAPQDHGTVFRFAVHNDSLQHGHSGDPTVSVRRFGPTQVEVTSAGIEPRHVRPGDPVDLTGGLRVAITDSRPVTHARMKTPKARTKPVPRTSTSDSDFPDELPTADVGHSFGGATSEIEDDLL